jgi:translocation and assembly module TamB
MTTARKVTRVLLKTFLFLIILLLVIFLAVLTPPVQRFLTARVENYLEKKLQTRVDIRRITFGLSGKINLEGVYLEDRAKDTLLAGGRIKARVNYLKLLSNDVRIRDLELTDITAKIKRVLPDTVFNFQFIVDAFTPASVRNDSTSSATPITLNTLSLDNVHLIYQDVITGSDLWADLGQLRMQIDSFDLEKQQYNIPGFRAANMRANIRQIKPLASPEPVITDIQEAAAPVMQLNFGTIDLEKVNLQYANDVSAAYADIAVDKLNSTARKIDLQQKQFYLDNLSLNNSIIAIRMGKEETVEIVSEEIVKEIEIRKETGWDFRIDKINLDNNSFRLDNLTAPAQNYGMDFNHLDAKQLVLKAENFIFKDDSIGARITQASVVEKSGFELNELHGDLLYSYNQSYAKDLLIRTPGTTLKRDLAISYASVDELTRHFERTVMEIGIEDSRIKVKDILVFAPQLRHQRAFANPEDTWLLDINGRGTLDQLDFQNLRFDGLSATHIDAAGRLSGLMNPQHAGGNFVIRRLHTTQNDIALFTGSRLSTKEIKLPEAFDVRGTITGSAGSIYTDLHMNTSSGAVSVKGKFNQLTNPAASTYTASIITSGLNTGAIFPQAKGVGPVSGAFTLQGKGMTASSVNARFTGRIGSLVYNNYAYQNIKLDGTIDPNNFQANSDINDPNADLALSLSGNLKGVPSFTVNGMVDSIKTLPLHLTANPLVMRGKIDGSFTGSTPDDMDADIWITNALFVSGTQRQPVDSMHIVALNNDTINSISLVSDVANAYIRGNYKLTQLGNIIQQSISPYFTVAPRRTTASGYPYHFTFNADIFPSPLITSFVPGLESFEPIHASGTVSDAAGINAQINSASVVYNGNQLDNISVNMLTRDSGLQVNGTIARVRQGTLDLYNARVQATAVNNRISFTAATDDPRGVNKYRIGGMLTQPTTGTYAISLNQDSLLLNYEMWSVAPGNQLIIGPGQVTASNFVLQRNDQRISLNSVGGEGYPLRVDFSQFRLATITAFMQSDTVMVDGLVNGQLVLKNLLQTPVFTSDLTVNDLSFQKDTLGNLHLLASTGNAGNYNLNAVISGRGNDVVMTGNFAPAGKDMNLELDLAVKQLQLSTAEGMLGHAITNSSGSVSGNVRIRGTASQPAINGDLNFNNAGFVIPMLGAPFFVDNQRVSVTDNGFSFNRFMIKDSLGNTMTLNGSLTTKNFTNYKFDMTLNARDFQLLNRPKAKDQIYYGKLNVTADLRLAGTELRPYADGTITINEGTDFFFVVPQSDAGVSAREGVVEFVDLDNPQNDSLFLARYDSLNNAGVVGLDLAVNIVVNKEAIFNLIVDEANGDLINVQGEAQLSAGIDPSGKMSLTGSYTLEKGAYQISFNFLQRKFEITKGSTITWNGAPTSGSLDVKAVYLAKTAPLDLVAEQLPADANRNIYMQKLPFEVHLSLTGELLKPEVAFDIILPEKNYGVSNDIVTAVQSKLGMLRQEQGEINKQVFSLLLMNRFVGENPLESSSDGFSVGSYARQSVSKLLTEELNQLAAGLIGGVDIDFDIASTEDYTTGDRRQRTDLNVGLSKRLLNERLKISIGSNFQLEGAQNSNRQSNNIAGDVAVDYQISKDGRYMIRFYRQNEYQGIVDGYIIETGLSFIISVDYNRFSQLFRKRRQASGGRGTGQN